MKICKLKPLVIVMATCGFLFFGSIVSAGSQPVEEVDKEVKGALMNEDWEKVARLLDAVSTEHPSPVLRMIKGHACLATNRNNESLCLFLSARGDIALSECKSWCEQFVQNTKGAPVAYYMLGDACARQGNCKEALVAFNAALAKRPGCPMTLNARGVVHAQSKEVAAARVDFAEAIEQSRGKLADVHANVGFLWIQKKENAEAALEAFNRALAESPDFALVYHGRACVKLLLPNKKEGAGEDIKLAAEKSACTHGILEENIVRYAARLNNADPEKVIASLGAPGTTLRTTFDADHVGAAAARDFGMAERFRGMEFLPFNQHFANFFGNRGVENLETIQKYGGERGIQNWGQKYSNLAPTAQSDMARVENYNIRAKPFEQATSDIGKALVGPGVGMALTGPDPVSKGVGAGMAVGGAAGIIAGNITHNWSNIHAREIPKIRPVIESGLGSRAPASNLPGSMGGSGGADSAMPNWVDGQWPFKPFYGIAYPQ